MPSAIVPPLDLDAAFHPPRDVFDELHASAGQPHPHWENVLHSLARVAPEELDRRSAQADQLIRENGVIYNAFAEGAHVQRPWKLDPIPLVFSAGEWDRLERGLVQRARLLDLIVKDLYGGRRLLKERVLPPAAVFAHPGFLRQCCELHPAGRTSLTLYASELARSPSGQWHVMADRTESPVGLGFALENRIVASQTRPLALHRISVQRLAPFFIRLQSVLQDMVTRLVENPRIVLLSRGPKHANLFEDVYLARYLGYTLVEGGDLAVRDDKVFLKTLAGLLPVDVILSRGPEIGLDPLEFGGGDTHGVPGLLQAIRKGNVAVANVPGTALVEAPIFMAFLPALCRHFLQEDLELPSIATWWCGDTEWRNYVLDRLDSLVIKPAFERSGSREHIGPEMTAAQRDELRSRIRAQPNEFVAQEMIRRSAAPVWRDGKIRCGHVAMRTFLLSSPEGSSLMPGGLVRVAESPGPFELSISAGDGSKDLWVLADGPVEPVTLLESREQPAQLRRTGALFPSRVADDLFWLGQAIDRADFLSRILRTTLDRISAEEDSADGDIPILIRALADQGQIEPGFVLQELSAQLPKLEVLLPASLFEVNEPRTLAAAVGELLRLASLVRDWMSPDTWRVLNRAGTAFLESGSAAADVLDALTAVNRLILDIAAASGLINDGMIRGPSWCFLDIGRRVERARNLARLVSSAIHSGRLSERIVLKALVELVDCRMTYRSRYLDNFQQNAVFDLCVTDETNPRSVAFQVAALADHVDTLPHDLTMPLRTEEKRLVMAAVHTVRMLTPEQLAAPHAPAVREMTETLEWQLRTLSETLTRKYLVHSGVPRQLSTGW